MTVNKLHSKILQLLHEIDSICRRYDITYYAAGGTAIGAVRHRGFIPWDDDADIYMTRNEFYRFREAFKKEQPEGRVLGCLDDNDRYPGTIPRYIDDETSLVAKYHCLNTCAAGIVIDIFILDPVPDDPALQKEHIGKLNIYADLVMPYYGYTNRADDRYLDMYTGYQERIKTEGREKIIEELGRELFSMDEDECSFYVLRWGTIPHIFEKSMFGRPVYFEYEDMQIPCPQRWYDYLVQLYGPKWMYIPPHIEDESHDFIVDCDHRYDCYLRDADRFIPADKALQVYRERKDLFVEREKLIRPFIHDVLMADARYVLKSQEIRLQDERADLKMLSDQKRYTEICDLFSVYLDMQFSPNFIGKMSHAFTYRYNNRIFIPLEDSRLEILLYAMFMTGDVKRCRTLLELRSSAGELSRDMESTQQKINDMYDLYKAFYSHDDLKADEILGRFSGHERRHVKDLFKIDMQLKIRNGADAEEIADALEAYGDDSDSEIIKIRGDLHHRQGDREKAEELYRKALPGLTNGMMMQEIGDRYGISMDYSTPADTGRRSELQDKQFQLLSEIDDICREHGISYYLYGDTLLYGYYAHVLGNEYKTNCIVMRPEDAVRFIEVCESELPADRKIDHSMNNDMHNGHTIYYCDRNTLSMDWRKLEASKDIGIHITIYILKKKDSNIAGWIWTRGLDMLVGINNKARDNRFKKNARLFTRLAGPALKLIGIHRLRKWVFRGYIRSGMKNPDRDYYLSKNNYRRSIGRYYGREFFSGSETTEIFGREFSVPADTERYIREVHGKYAADDVKIRKRIAPLFKVADCRMDFSDMEQIIEESGFSDEDITRYKKGVTLNPQINKLNKLVRSYWEILLRGQDRFRLAVLYMPQKEKIMSLYEEKRYKELEELLSDYDRSVRKHMKKGLGLSFDHDITRIYCERLRAKGESGFAQKLENKIPDEHREPVYIKQEVTNVLR